MGVRSNRLPLQVPKCEEVFRVNLGSGHLRYKDFALLGRTGCRHPVCEVMSTGPCPARGVAHATGSNRRDQTSESVSGSWVGSVVETVPGLRSDASSPDCSCPEPSGPDS
jgi:hypothetical protein